MFRQYPLNLHALRIRKRGLTVVQGWAVTLGEQEDEA